MIISSTALEAVANKGGKLASEEYHKTVSLCVRHKDLPGIWPKFYLYSDMTWDIGYEPRTAVEAIAVVDIKDFTARELLVALEAELGYNRHTLDRLAMASHGELSDHAAASGVAATSTSGSGTEEHQRTGKTRARLPAARKGKKRAKATW